MRHVTLYGLYDKIGRCRYIGATIDPKTRETNHRMRFPRFKFKILKRCIRSRAYAEEVRLIRTHKKSGECDFNKQLAGRHWKQVKGVSLGNKQMRLNANNLNKIERLRRSMFMPTSVPRLVNFILEKHGIPQFVESDLYRDAIK